MPPKKPNRSPFGLYMSKMRRDDPSLRSIPMNQLVSHCNRLYDELEPEVKTRLEKLSCLVRNSGLDDTEINRQLSKLSLTAEDDNNWDDQKSVNSYSGDVKPSLGFKYTGISDQKLEIPQMFVEEEEEECVDTFAIVEQVFERTKNLPKRTIVCICFNILVHTFDDKYYPNEIGLIKWTLEDGIEEEFTKLISNEPPNGYYAKAKEFSEAYHKIPVNTKDNKDFESDIPKLFGQIYDFMSASDLTDKNRKLVFCKAEGRVGQSDRHQVVGCLKWFDQQIHSSKEPMTKSFIEDFQVVELSDLLFLTLKKYCAEPRPKALCVEALTRTIFDYHPNLRCDFHAIDDNNYCSLAVIKRSAFLYFDLLFSLGKGLELYLKMKPSHRPTKVESNSSLSQMTIIERPMVKTRPQFRYTVEQEEQPNQAELNRNLQVGLGRGKKFLNLLSAKTHNN